MVTNTNCKNIVQGGLRLRFLCVLVPPLAKTQSIYYIRYYPVRLRPAIKLEWLLVRRLYEFMTNLPLHPYHSKKIVSKEIFFVCLLFFSFFC
jgi:hypothetical protein